MNATARKTLEYLADRYKRASLASQIAEWIELPLPKVQAALVYLRDQGHVRYFEGHPGVWVVTESGCRETNPLMFPSQGGEPNA